jgi:hypothetical protein
MDLGYKGNGKECVPIGYEYTQFDCVLLGVRGNHMVPLSDLILDYNGQVDTVQAIMEQSLEMLRKKTALEHGVKYLRNQEMATVLASSEDIIVALSSLQEDMHILREEQIHRLSSHEALRSHSARLDADSNAEKLLTDQSNQRKIDERALSQAVSRFAEILTSTVLAPGQREHDETGDGEDDDAVSRSIEQQICLLRGLEARARALVALEGEQLPALREAVHAAERHVVQIKRETAERMHAVASDDQQGRDYLRNALEATAGMVQRLREDKGRIEESQALAEEMFAAELNHLWSKLQDFEQCMQRVQASCIEGKAREAAQREEEGVQREKERAELAHERERIRLALQDMEKQKEDECARTEKMIMQHEREKEEWETQSKVERENAQNMLDTKDKVIGSLHEVIMDGEQKLLELSQNLTGLAKCEFQREFTSLHASEAEVTRLHTSLKELESAAAVLDANGLFLLEECNRLKKSLDSSVEEGYIVRQTLEKREHAISELRLELARLEEIGCEMLQDQEKLFESKAKEAEIDKNQRQQEHLELRIELERLEEILVTAQHTSSVELQQMHEKSTRRFLTRMAHRTLAKAFDGFARAVGTHRVRHNICERFIAKGTKLRIQSVIGAWSEYMECLRILRASEADIKDVRDSVQVEREQREAAASSMLEKVRREGEQESLELLRQHAAVYEESQAEVGHLKEEMERLKDVCERLQMQLEHEQVQVTEDFKIISGRLAARVEGEKRSYDATGEVWVQVGEIERLMLGLQQHCLEKEDEDERTKISLDILKQNLSQTVEIYGDQLKAINAQREAEIAQMLKSSFCKEQELQTHLMACEKNMHNMETSTLLLGDSISAAAAARQQERAEADRKFLAETEELRRAVEMERSARAQARLDSQAEEQRLRALLLQMERSIEIMQEDRRYEIQQVTSMLHEEAELDKLGTKLRMAEEGLRQQIHIAPLLNAHSIFGLPAASENVGMLTALGAENDSLEGEREASDDNVSQIVLPTYLPSEQSLRQACRRLLEPLLDLPIESNTAEDVVLQLGTPPPVIVGSSLRPVPSIAASRSSSSSSSQYFKPQTPPLPDHETPSLSSSMRVKRAAFGSEGSTGNPEGSAMGSVRDRGHNEMSDDLLNAMGSLRCERARFLECQQELNYMRMWARRRCREFDQRNDLVELRLAEFMLAVQDRERERDYARDQACLMSASLAHHVQAMQQLANDWGAELNTMERDQAYVSGRELQEEEPTTALQEEMQPVEQHSIESKDTAGRYVAFLTSNLTDAAFTLEMYEAAAEEAARKLESITAIADQLYCTLQEELDQTKVMQVRQQSQKTEKILIDSVMQEQTFVATALEEQVARLEDQAARLATQLEMSVRTAEKNERERMKANIEDNEVVAEVTTRWFAVSQTLEEVIQESEGHQHELHVRFQDMCGTVNMLEIVIAEFGSRFFAETEQLAAVRTQIAGLEKERKADRERLDQSVQMEREVCVRLEDAFESVHRQLHGLEGSVDAIQLNAETKHEKLVDSFRRVETAEHEMEKVFKDALEPLAHSIEAQLKLLTVAVQSAAEEREHARALNESEAQMRLLGLQQHVKTLAESERELEKALETSGEQVSKLQQRNKALTSELAEATRGLRVVESNNMMALMHQFSVEQFLESLSACLDSLDDRVSAAAIISEQVLRHQEQELKLANLAGIETQEDLVQKLYDARIEIGQLTNTVYQLGVEGSVMTEFTKELRDRIAELEMKGHCNREAEEACQALGMQGVQDILRELDELKSGFTEEANLLEEEAVRMILMSAAKDKERERREGARERDMVAEMQALQKDRENELEAQRRNEIAAAAERERERAARQEARQSERQAWESERRDVRAQQDSVQVCAEVLGRDLQMREAEIAFLQSQIFTLENMLQAAFKEGTRDKEAWALDKEEHELRDAARLQYLEAEHSGLHSLYEQIEFERSTAREREMFRYTQELASAAEMVQSVRTAHEEAKAGCLRRLEQFIKTVRSHQKQGEQRAQTEAQNEAQEFADYTAVIDLLGKTVEARQEEVVSANASVKMLQHMLSQEQMLNEEQALLQASFRVQYEDALASSLAEAQKTRREDMVSFSSHVSGLLEESEGVVRDIARVLGEVVVRVMENEALSRRVTNKRVTRLVAGTEEQVQKVDVTMEQIAKDNFALLAARDALEEELEVARVKIAAHKLKVEFLEKTLQTDESELALSRALLQKDREERSAKDEEICTSQKAIAALQVELDVVKAKLDENERVLSAQQKDAQELVVEFTFDRPFSEVQDRTDNFSTTLLENLHDAMKSEKGHMAVLWLRPGSVIATVVMPPGTMQPGRSLKEAIARLQAQCQDPHASPYLSQDDTELRDLKAVEVKSTLSYQKQVQHQAEELKQAHRKVESHNMLIEQLTSEITYLQAKLDDAKTHEHQSIDLEKQAETTGQVKDLFHFHIRSILAELNRVEETTDDAHIELQKLKDHQAATTSFMQQMERESSSCEQGMKQHLSAAFDEIERLRSVLEQEKADTFSRAALESEANAARQASRVALHYQSWFTTGLQTQMMDLRSMGGAELHRLSSMLQDVDEAVDRTQLELREMQNQTVARLAAVQEHASSLKLAAAAAFDEFSGREDDIKQRLAECLAEQHRLVNVLETKRQYCAGLARELSAAHQAHERDIEQMRAAMQDLQKLLQQEFDILELAEEQSRKEALETNVQRSLELEEQKSRKAQLEHRLQQAEELLAQREQALADSEAENKVQKIAMTQTIDQVIARVAEVEASLESQQVAHNDLTSAGAEKDAESASKDAQIEELKEHSMRLDRQLAQESEKKEALAQELVDLQGRAENDLRQFKDIELAGARIEPASVALVRTPPLARPWQPLPTLFSSQMCLSTDAQRALGQRSPILKARALASEAAAASSADWQVWGCEADCGFTSRVYEEVVHHENCGCPLKQSFVAWGSDMDSAVLSAPSAAADLVQAAAGSAPYVSFVSGINALCTQDGIPVLQSPEDSGVYARRQVWGRGAAGTATEGDKTRIEFIESKKDLETRLEASRAEAGMMKSRAEDLERRLNEATKAGSALSVANAELKEELSTLQAAGSTHIMPVGRVPDDLSVMVELVLDMNFSEVLVDEHASQAFKTDVSSQVAQAVGADPNGLHILGLRPGSIILQMGLESNLCADGRSTLEVAREIKRQVLDTASALRQGRCTASACSANVWLREDSLEALSDAMELVEDLAAQVGGLNEQLEAAKERRYAQLDAFQATVLCQQREQAASRSSKIARSRSLISTRGGFSMRKRTFQKWLACKAEQHESLAKGVDDLAVTFRDVKAELSSVSSRVLKTKMKAFAEVFIAQQQPVPRPLFTPSTPPLTAQGKENVGQEIAPGEGKEMQALPIEMPPLDIFSLLTAASPDPTEHGTGCFVFGREVGQSEKKEWHGRAWAHQDEGDGQWGLRALEEAKTAEEAALAKLEQSLLDRRLLAQRLAEVESEVQKLKENVGDHVLELEEAKSSEGAALAKLEQSLLDRRLLVQRLAEFESEVQKLTENVGEYVLKVSFLSSLLSPLPCFDAS